jgi:hypothetical protein
MGYGLRPSKRARFNLSGKKVNSPIIETRIVSTPVTKVPLSPVIIPKQFVQPTFNHTCFIVGGGPSLINFDFNRLINVNTIVVNNAIFDAVNPNYFITKDYSFFLKVGIVGSNFKQQRFNSFVSTNAEKVFVAGYYGDTIKDKDEKIYDTKLKLFYDTDLFDTVVKSTEAKGIGTSFDDFRCGGDSGYCALQLAILLKFKTIYLLGIDLVTRARSHYHNAYRWRGAEVYKKKLESWFNLYVNGIDEIRNKTSSTIFSCSPISRLNTIVPYIPLESIL